MAARFFCDLCKSPCEGRSTRRWEFVFGDVGFEVVLLKGHKPTGDIHVCDDCILKGFWTMLERGPDSPLRHRKQALDAFENTYRRKENMLLEKEENLKVLSNNTDRKISELNKLLAECNDHKETKEKFDTLQSQFEALRKRESDIYKKGFNEGKQAAVDEKCYKDYISRVSYREYRRNGH